MDVVDSFVPIEHIAPTLPGGTGIVPTHLPGSTTTNGTVCLSNLPADVDDTVLCQLVRPYGTVQSIQVLRDDRCAVIAMSSGDDALRVLAAFNGRLIGDCVIQAALTAPHYSNAPASRPASSLMAVQPIVGLLSTPGCQTVLLRNTAAAAAVHNSEMMRQCLPPTYPPAQTYELVQLPIM